MNRVILMGRLGSDPESKALKGGPLCKFSIATSEKYTGRDREKHEVVEWHNISVFGKFAEPCMKYLSKGSKVLIEGKLKTRSWTTENGEKRFQTVIVAARVIFLDSKKEHEESEPGEVEY